MQSAGINQMLNTQIPSVARQINSEGYKSAGVVGEQLLLSSSGLLLESGSTELLGISIFHKKTEPGFVCEISKLKKILM